MLRTAGALALTVTGMEGCLSVPGQRAEVTRAAVAAVTGTDLRGRPVSVTGPGLLARCLRHESDYLRGIVYAGLLPAAGQVRARR